MPLTQPPHPADAPPAHALGALIRRRCQQRGMTLSSLAQAAGIKPVEGQRVGRSIDYRHLVGALKRKPGAFARWVLRDPAFPRAVYRQTWERLSAQRPEREACKTMVGLLAPAADGQAFGWGSVRPIRLGRLACTPLLGSVAGA